MPIVPSLPLPPFAHAANSLHADAQTALAAGLEQVERLLLTAPQDCGLLSLRATFLVWLGRWQEARQTVETWLAVAPDAVDGWNVLGNIHVALEQPAQAADCYHQALRLQPDAAWIHVNLGNLAQFDLRLSDAQQHYRKAIQLDPALAEAELELSHCAFLAGNWCEGWQGYHARWRTRQLAPHHLVTAALIWQGEGWLRELPSATLLIWAEQGIGDSLQFIRYLPWLREHLPAPIRLICRLPDSLLPLLVEDDCVLGVSGIHAIPESAALSPHDAHCPLLSLPCALLAVEGEAGLWISPAPYLMASQSRQAAWQQRWHSLESQRVKGRRRRVGVVWSGRALPVPNPTRDIPLAELQPLVQNSTDRIDWVSLQPECFATDHSAYEQLVSVCGEPFGWGKTLSDWAETAALLMSLDEVISVDSAVAHLAGALGKPVTLLLRYRSEWRWQCQGESTPWYPQHRLLRQPQAGDWHSVMTELQGSLCNRQ